jgi:hypothetical protein
VCVGCCNAERAIGQRHMGATTTSTFEDAETLTPGEAEPPIGAR